MRRTPPVKRVPNPGSDAALDAGCICAVLDNNHGTVPPRPPDGWWVRLDCPVHAVGMEDRR